jgi:sugar phosphate isomerase/epimerase
VTVILSGFADEISDDLDVQLEVLAKLSIRHLELRSAWSVNVAELDDQQVGRVRRALDGAGVAVSAIGSPIGKIPVDAPLGPELERLRRVADIAGALGTSLVRVFSFFIPSGRPATEFRGVVLDRMAALAGVAEERGLVLAHENEKEIYGDVPERCAEIIRVVGSPALRATFDAANFVQCGVAAPHDQAYPLLAPYLEYLQVKDALAATGAVVPAGMGDGQVRRTLAALDESGFAGFVSLEPHLAVAGRFGGFSGPEDFTRAASALKELLAGLGMSWR